jgi:diguanylate cyclase (GGDEF)-like protein
VLVAHFDAAERERLAALFREAGAEVVTASDGIVALDAATTKPFTLAVVACMLPALSGFELCRRLCVVEVTRPAIPTMLLSDVDDPYVRARARHVGAKRVLFGTIGGVHVRELLATDWSRVDPLEISSRDERSSRGDRLVRELLTADSRHDDSLIAKVSDPLTGLVNAEYLALKIEDECKRSSRYGRPCSLLVCDLVGFDQIVEKHGRAVGEEALLEVAGVLLCESRDVDVAGRAGAARFHLLLPDTPLAGARTVAHRILASISTRRLAANGVRLPLEARMGVASIATGARANAEEFVREAELDVASAELSRGGLSDRLRANEPVEPIAPLAPAPAAPR